MTESHDGSESFFKTPLYWNDAVVPLQERGISRRWLLRFAENVLQQVNTAKVQNWIREQDEVAGTNQRRSATATALTTHGLVNGFIKPFTEPVEAPLYAFVPDQFCGRPTTFISHTWSSLLLGPRRQEIGTLDALEESEHDFVWIDFACYNQHTFRAVAGDMLDVIGAIGSVTVCATPTPIYSRGWCLWELLCADRSQAEVSLLVRRCFRNDKIMSVNALYRSFRGVETAQSSKPEDREMILRECLSHFGSVERADAEFERIIREKFSSGWHELQDKNERMKFSPAPWISGADAATSEPYFLPGLLDSVVFDSDLTVRELFADAGVYLGETEAGNAAAARAVAAQEKLDAVTQEFIRDLLAGDLAGVTKYLNVGCDVEMTLDTLTPLLIAAGRGYTAIVKLLIDAGAKIERADVDLSPLRVAADKGHRDVVSTLLARGAAVDAADSETGWTALMWASASGHDDVVTTLLDHDADVSHCGSGKRPTALHLAAQNGHSDCVRTLLARGARLEDREYRGLTPLHLAAAMGHSDVVRILLRHGADRDARGSKGQTAQSLAEDSRRRDVLQLLQSFADGSGTPSSDKSESGGDLLRTVVSTGQWDRLDELVRDLSFVRSISAVQWAVLYPQLVDSVPVSEEHHLKAVPFTLANVAIELRRIVVEECQELRRAGRPGDEVRENYIDHENMEEAVHLWTRAFAAMVAVVNYCVDTGPWLVEFFAFAKGAGLENLAPVAQGQNGKMKPLVEHLLNEQVGKSPGVVGFRNVGLMGAGPGPGVSLPVLGWVIA